MSSEWMKVMLDEIARKKAEAEQAQVELEMRRDERAGGSSRAEIAGPRVRPPDDPAQG
jgi:hypothetical protein